MYGLLSQFGDTLCLPILCGLPLVALLLVYRNRSSASKDRPKDKVVLYQIGRGKQVPSVSPFPLKLETYLRMAEIPYVNDHSGKFSSKGKTPWMEYNGVAVADSQFCIEFLNKKLGVDLNSHLTPTDKAIGRAFQKMAEENLYWTMCYHTFMGDLKAVASVMPYTGVKLWVVLKVLQRTIKKELWGQGIGRHTYEEAMSIGFGDMRAISAFLGDKTFLFGDKPSEFDCAIFGMMCMILWNMPGSPHEKLMKEELTNITGYIERMKEKFWPDWSDCLAN